MDIHKKESNWNVILWNAESYFWAQIFREGEFINPSLENTYFAFIPKKGPKDWRQVYRFLATKRECDHFLFNFFFGRAPMTKFLIFSR